MENIRLTQEESDILYNLLIHELDYEDELKASKDGSYDRRYRSRLVKLMKKIQELG